MWMSRYILLRLGEEMGAHVDFEPKPIKGAWVKITIIHTYIILFNNIKERFRSPY